jgi:hypothetical protein
MKPNKKDIAEWEVLCQSLDKIKGKSSYRSYCTEKVDGKWVMIDIPNWHLLSQEPVMLGMRKWMKQNGYELVFYGSGWGWRLRKDWKEKIDRLRERQN